MATVQADLSDPAAVTAAVGAADLVVCAVPGFLGFQTLKAILQAGKNVVDISFFPEEALLLDDLAREQGVTAVVDCGVAPGLCNIMAGHAVGLLDEAHSYSCYVGGLPVVRTWPYEYRSVFSPVDVLEEYTRPARQVEHGQEVVRPALSELELLDFPGVGTLEAFNTDGLRTLRHTLRLPFMKEKTLRYPGHANLMRVFRESGFFGAEPVDVGGQAVRPVDLTSRLLFAQWRPADAAEQEDFTVMQVVVEGTKDGRPASTLRPAGPLRPGQRGHRHGPHHRLHLRHRGAAGGQRPLRPPRHLPARIPGPGPLRRPWAASRGARPV